jgi:hypothetical protein
MCRDFAGINNSRLYNTALTGTKDQIKEFRAVVTESLEYIRDHPTFEDKLVNCFFSLTHLDLLQAIIS